MADRSRTLVGVDESGTGAWAGPFTVCAYASTHEDTNMLAELGARDSKKLSDKNRRAVFDQLAAFAIVAKCVVVDNMAIQRLGLKDAWRNAVVDSIKHVVEITGYAEVVVDGNADSWVRYRLSDAGIKLVFMPKADDKVHVVGAASILAKTIRNDHMIGLHQKYPEYGWDRNMGYGSPEHEAVLKRIGKTEEHRPWKNLESIGMRPRFLDNNTGVP